MRKILFDKVFIVLFFVSLIGFIASIIIYIDTFSFNNYIRMGIFTLDMIICAMMYMNERIKRKIIEIQKIIDKKREMYKINS